MSLALHHFTPQSNVYSLETAHGHTNKTLWRPGIDSLENTTTTVYMLLCLNQIRFIHTNTL